MDEFLHDEFYWYFQQLQGLFVVFSTDDTSDHSFESPNLNYLMNSFSTNHYKYVND